VILRADDVDYTQVQEKSLRAETCTSAEVGW
jgi:hypothetical protein